MNSPTSTPRQQLQDAVSSAPQLPASYCTLVVLSAIFLTLAASGAPSPLYVEYQHEWGFSPTILTTVYATYAAGVVVSLLLLGGVSDRLGRKPAILISFGLVLFSLLIFFFAPSVEWLYIARAVQGLATGVFTATATALLTDVEPQHAAGHAATYNSAVQSTGIAMGALLACLGLALQTFPLQFPYAVLLIIGVLNLLALFGVRETVQNPQRLQWRFLVKVQKLALPAAARPEFATAVLVVVVAWSVAGIYLSLGGTISKQLFNSSSVWLPGLMVLLLQGFGGLISLLFRKVSTHRATILALLALLIGLVIVVIGVGNASTPAFLIGNLVTGAGFGIGFMSSTRRISASAPSEQRGEVMAAYFISAYLAISVPTIIAAKVSEVFGLSATFSWLCLVLMALAAVTLIRVIMRGKLTRS
ncbi:MFS transporter [Psychromicrobium lacuslunae]|uniref:Major facilitator superfamily (MFS) profile domain-containing protein n=1 Tax=Psychromicrobium lacuslunae TaxID=1618207 RepID=A0A0D4BZI2_9MICC|nr:MFS transporter [Psychromicrobium lacuslunae]AJT41724.1 hypothetical protein UM93_09745 [Psychromicrobium lacuslunae]